MRILSIVFLIFSLSLANLDPYRLIHIQPVKDDQTELSLSSLALDIVKTDEKGTIHAVVHSKEMVQLEKAGIPFTVEIEDMEQYYSSRMKGSTNFGNYHTYAESNAILDALHAQYPTITSKRIELGTSREGNKIWAMKISDNPDLDEDEPEVLFTGIHHAREPIGVNMCDTLVKILCEGYSTNSDIKYLVDNREIWVVPVVNPDGYLYNEAQNPGGGGMWRKTRRDNGDGTFGVDPNRNYGFKWGHDNGGSSPDPSAETYRGPEAFSEPCNKVMRDFFNDHTFVACVHIHSYGNLILYPWGYTPEKSEDDALFERLSKDMNDLAVAATGQEYECGTAPAVLYSVNGGAEDWAYGEQTSKPKCLAFCFEVGEQFWQEELIEEHLRESMPMCMYLIRVVGRWLSFSSVSIKDGNNNHLDPGEKADVVVELKHIGITGGAFSNVTGKLKTQDNFVTIEKGDGSFGTINGGSNGNNSQNPFTIKAHPLTPQGHKVHFSLELKDASGFSSVVPVELVIGKPLPALVFFEDDFEYSNGIDSFPLLWETSGNWSRNSDHASSGTHAASSGDFVKSGNLIMKPVVNLASYANPLLTFTVRGKCDWPEEWKFLRVYLSSSGGTSWEQQLEIKGETGDPRWQTQSVSLKNYSMENVKIKFQIDAIGNVNSATFWVDDVSITVPYDNEPPAFTNTTLWHETYQTGPFDISSTITDVNTVKDAVLHYRVNNSSWQTKTLLKGNEDLYKAAIPAQSGTGTIDYYLEASDTWPGGSDNRGCFPVGANKDAGFHSFVYGSTAIKTSNRQPTISFTRGGTQGSLHIHCTLPKKMMITLNLFDVLGRKIKTLCDKPLAKGTHSFIWQRDTNYKKQVSSGIYFLSLGVGKKNERRMVTKLVVSH